MIIDTITIYLLNAMLAAPAVSVATVFVAMLLETHKAALFRAHRFALLPAEQKVGAKSSEAAETMESQVVEAQHELAGLSSQRAASPAVLAQTAVAHARSAQESVVDA